jgi:Flp pilus assembly pilin Flp
MNHQGGSMMMRERIALTEDLGQTMAEYAFVLSVIVIAIITAFGVLSGAIATSIDNAVTIVRSLP